MRNLKIPYILIMGTQLKSGRAANCSKVRTEKNRWFFERDRVNHTYAMAHSIGSGETLRVELTAADIPGAHLDEPLERHGVPALKR